MKAPVQIALLLAVSLGSFPLRADSPRVAPADRKQFSLNHRFFLLSKLKERGTWVFAAKNPSTPLWQIPVYIGNPEISNDGTTVAAIYEGGNILDASVKPGEPLVTLYDSHSKKRVYTVGEVAGDTSKLRRTTSGFLWERDMYFDGANRFRIVLDNGKTISLDMTGAH